VRVSIIVAMADNRVIGRAQQLPWHLPDDLKRFKALTMGKPILMGRRTYESIGRALPGRRNLVLSRNSIAEPHADTPPTPATLAVGTTLERVASLAEALQRCAAAGEVCVIGGADVFQEALPLATHLYLTRVCAQIEGDVWFPDFDPGEWRETARLEHLADERHAWPLTFIDLERQSARRASR
jgi:dihydrofolate reductase